jgi:hypothetical protein
VLPVPPISPLSIVSNEKYTRYSCQILMTFNFLNILPKNSLMPNFIKIRPVGAELLHADGQTDRNDGVIFVSSQFCECA